MISFPFPPNATAGAVRSERFARYLPELGWSVDVVTIKPKDVFFQDNARLKYLGPNVNVHLTKHFDPWAWLLFKRPTSVWLKVLRSVFMRLFSFPDHLIFWIPFALKKSLLVCKQNHIDAIYTTSPPHSTHLAGLILSKLTKKPWVTDFRDPWTLNALRNKGTFEGLLSNIEKIMEKCVLRKASVILANTQVNRKNLLANFPFLKEEKVVHLPNGWEEFPLEFYRSGRKGGPLTVVHAGNFYSHFKPYGLLYALAAWRNGERSPDIPPLKNKDIKVILLGSRDEAAARVSKELNISEFVEVRQWVALEDARKIMCEADLLWASLGTGNESSTFIPSKLFEYIAAKKPIIGFFPEGEAASLIRETGTGFVFTNDDPIPIIQFLNDMILKKSGRIPAWYNPNYSVINKYNIKTITSELSQILNDMV